MESKKLKIKVLVDGKYLQLEINRDSEQVVRDAALRLNGKLFEYKSGLKLDTAEDYLRIVALQYAVEVVNNEYRDKEATLNSDLSTLESKLNKTLSEIE